MLARRVEDKTILLDREQIEELLQLPKVLEWAKLRNSSTLDALEAFLTQLDPDGEYRAAHPDIGLNQWLVVLDQEGAPLVEDTFTWR